MVPSDLVSALFSTALYLMDCVLFHPSVFHFVCLSVYRLSISRKITDRILMKLLRIMRLWTRKNLLNFVSDPLPDSVLGIFKKDSSIFFSTIWPISLEN